MTAHIEGIPRLVDALLPSKAPRAPAPCRRWLEAMLLEPPTYAVARRIKDALYELELVEAGLPLCLPISAVRINLGLGFVFFLGGGLGAF